MRQSRLRNRSARLAALLRVYAKKRAAFLEARPWCLRCGGTATEVHHMAGRVGDLLLDESKWAAVSVATATATSPNTLPKQLSAAGPCRESVPRE